MIFVRQQGEVLPSDFLISRQGAVGRDQPLNANSAAAVAGFLCLGISSDDPGATSGSRYEQGITRRVAVLHCVATWGRCLNEMADNIVGSGRDARGRTTVLPKALADRRWRPGQSGNPAGHTGEYGEVMKIARSYAPAAMHRLAELAELSQLDSEGNLVPLSDLPDADRRVIAVAANSILDRAFGKPKAAEGEKDDMGAQIASMSREQRLALMRMLLEPMRRYLPAAKTATSSIEGNSFPRPKD